MDDGVIGTEAERSEIGRYSSVKYPRLLQDIAQVNVGIQEGGVQLYCLVGERGGEGRGEGRGERR